MSNHGHDCVIAANGHDLHNDEKHYHEYVQHHFGEIQPGLVYEKIRYIADPTWEDFSSTALGPVLHYSSTTTPSQITPSPPIHRIFERQIRCTATHFKSIVVNASNSLYCSTIRLYVVCVLTENYCVCVYYTYDDIQDDKNKVLPIILRKSCHDGDWIKGRQFRAHFYFDLTQPGLACERINLYITGPTCEDFSNMILRPVLEPINYSSPTVVVSY